MKKVIIFDLDGTLYDLNDVVQTSYDMQIEFLSMKKGLSREDSISFLAKNHVYPVMKKDSKSATELFFQLGFDKKEWSDYRDKRFNVDKIDNNKAIAENVIAEFSNLATIVLLSSNAYAVIEKVLNHIDISANLFDDIICSDRFPYDVPFKKGLPSYEFYKDPIESWASKYKVKFDEMISIGDRYETDIKPIIELGGCGILVRKPISLETILSDIKNDALHSCDDYDFYLAS